MGGVKIPRPGAVGEYDGHTKWVENEATKRWLARFLRSLNKLVQGTVRGGVMEYITEEQGVFSVSFEELAAT